MTGLWWAKGLGGIPGAGQGQSRRVSGAIALQSQGAESLPCLSAGDRRSQGHPSDLGLPERKKGEQRKAMVSRELRRRRTGSCLPRLVGERLDSASLSPQDRRPLPGLAQGL